MPIRHVLPATCHEGVIEVRSNDQVRCVRFYTRSDDPHSRQLVARMQSREEHRFSELEMGDKLRSIQLPIKVVRDIEKAAIKKVKEFDPNDDSLILDSTDPDFVEGSQGEVTIDKQRQDDFDVAQRLLWEFQIEVEAIYGE